MDNSYYNSEEIDLKNIFSALRRNTKKILFLSSISTVLIFSYLNSLKPLWRGSFNIVVKTREQTPSNNSSNFQNILSFNKSNSNETEKLILQSPLVLKPVYEYVLKYDKNQGNSTEALTFKRWLSTFKIDFEKYYGRSKIIFGSF